MRAFLLTILVALVFAAPASADLPPFHAVHITGGRVLDIGDSHTWFAGAGEQYPRWDTDSQPGRSTAGGLAILPTLLASRHRVVVFDLATNDRSNPDAVFGNVAAADALIGHRQLVLVTCRTAPPSLCGPINRALRLYALGHPRVHVVKWARTVKRHPNWFGPDGVHLTSTGYQHRTTKIKRAVRRIRQEEE